MKFGSCLVRYMWLFWCVVSRLESICCYNLQRIDPGDKDLLPINVEIELFSSSDYEAAQKIFEAMKNQRNESEMDSAYFDEWGAKINPLIVQAPTAPPPQGDPITPLDSWSVIWYIASFGGLIAFFLIVSCSEWCCRRAVRNARLCRTGGDTAPANQRANASSSAVPRSADVPPPSYDEFAPPSYESISSGQAEKTRYDVYVVPVHALSTIANIHSGGTVEGDEPPSYVSAAASATGTA